MVPGTETTVNVREEQVKTGKGKGHIGVV